MRVIHGKTAWVGTAWALVAGGSLAMTSNASAAVTLAQYDFDSIQNGTVVQDISGNGHAATFNQTTSLDADDPFNTAAGSSAALTGDASSSDTHLATAANPGGFDFYGTGSDQNRLTLEAWIKPTAQQNANEYIIFIGDNDSGTTRVSLGVNSAGNLAGRVYVASSGTGFVDTGVAVPLNDWSHIAMEWHKGNSLNFYLNGAQVASYNSSSGIGNLNRSWASITVDQVHVGASWSGLIDDVRISNGLVPQNELGYHHSFTPVPEPGSASLVVFGVLGPLMLNRRKRAA